MLSLQEIDTQCATSLALAPPNPRLSEENLRGYIVLLSAHFQGFCRDLYTECAQIVAATLPFPLQVVAQTQFTASLALDRGNPNRDSIQRDFDRFGTPLNLDAADPANYARLRDLGRLNFWRNVVAHHNVVPPGGSRPKPTCNAGGIPAMGWRHPLTESCIMSYRGFLRPRRGFRSGGGDLWQG